VFCAVTSSLRPTRTSGGVRPTRVSGHVRPTRVSGHVRPTRVSGGVRPTRSRFGPGPTPVSLFAILLINLLYLCIFTTELTSTRDKSCVYYVI